MASPQLLNISFDNEKEKAYEKIDNSNNSCERQKPNIYFFSPFLRNDKEKENKNKAELCKRILKTFLEIIYVFLLPFASFFVELYYAWKFNSNTLGIVLIYERVHLKKTIGRFKKLLINELFFVIHFCFNCSCFTILILNCIGNNDSSLSEFIENSFRFIYFYQILCVVFYITNKIRPFNKVSINPQKFKRYFDLNVTQNISFLGSFENDSATLEKTHDITVYQLESNLEKKFQNNVEQIASLNLGNNKYLIFFLVLSNSLNLLAMLSLYFSENSISLYRFWVIFSYTICVNVLFSSFFIYSFFDFTFSKKLYFNQKLFDMIVYFNSDEKIKFIKMYPTINFLNQESLIFWNNLRKWNLRRTGGKKVLVIDSFMVLILIALTFIWIAVLFKIYGNINVIFQINLYFFLNLIIHTIQLDIIFLWKLYQGALVNSYFMLFYQQFMNILQDFQFLKLKLNVFANLSRSTRIKTTKEQFFLKLYETLKENKNIRSEKNMIKQIVECENLIKLIMDEIKLDEENKKIKFLQIIPLNFTFFKTIGLTLFTSFFSLLKLVIG